MSVFSNRLPSLKECLFAGAAAVVSFACSAHAQAQQVVKVAYSADYYPSTPQMLTSWVQEVQQEAKKLLPGVTIEPEPIHGGFDDFLTKLSLMYGNPSAAPDLALVPAQEVGQWQGSGLLAELGDRARTDLVAEQVGQALHYVLVRLPQGHGRVDRPGT